MVSRAAVNQRVGSAGVVSIHAAYAAAVACGGLGGEKESVGFKCQVQLVTHYTGLHPYPAFFSIDFKYFVQMTADVCHDAIAYHLSSDRGSSSTRYDMSLSFACGFYQLFYILDRLRISHSHRQLTVSARIRGVGNAVKVVGEELHLLDTLYKLFGESRVL